MRTDILDLHGFYASPLGGAARAFITERLTEVWRPETRCRIAGFGYAEPYLEAFGGAERVLALSPAGQGVVRWPAGEKNRAALVADHHWPLPDASIDRLLIVHGLEEAGKPRRLMREAWRVLTNDGRLIVVAPHRRGVWSMGEATPFGHGRPYLRGQIERLFRDCLFRPTNWTGALYFPPTGARFMLRAARAWERAGAGLWPWFGGVILVEAQKDMARPVARPLALRARLATPTMPPMPQGAAPRPATRGVAARGLRPPAQTNTCQTNT